MVVIKMKVLCPNDGTELVQDGKFLVCPKCHKVWFIKELNLVLEEFQLWGQDGDEKLN